MPCIFYIGFMKVISNGLNFSLKRSTKQPQLSIKVDLITQLRIKQYNQDDILNKQVVNKDKQGVGFCEES